MPDLQIGHDLLDRLGLEWLLERRQHPQLELLAGLPDGVEHRRATAAHQLHAAGETGFAQRFDRGEGVWDLEVDVEEDHIGRPGCRGLAERRSVAELDGVDAAALEDQRHELPDTGFFVDDEGKRIAPPVGRRRRRRRKAWPVQALWLRTSVQPAGTQCPRTAGIIRGYRLNIGFQAPSRCRYSRHEPPHGRRPLPGENHGFQHAFHESARNSQAGRLPATWWRRSQDRRGSSTSPASSG